MADLEALGVAVRDQNGYLLDGISILSNYAQATKNLSQIEKARTDELLGGVFQINQLKALTGDLAKANGVYARLSLCLGQQLKLELGFPKNYWTLSRLIKAKSEKKARPLENL